MSSTTRVVDPDLTTGCVDVSAERSEAASSVRAGEKLGRYEIERELGRGGMGVVFAAFDPQLDRAVALKVLKPAAAGSTAAEGGGARLMREAQAMAGLSHPNVIGVYDVGRIDGRVYIAMELVSGKNMRDWLAAEQPWRRVIEVMVQAGRGLAAAHAAGIVHRDFKPGNVLLGDDGRVRVVDFGLARSRGDDSRGRDEVSATSAGAADGSGEIARADASSVSRSGRLPALTEAGAVMGTPAYMAPEQAAGDVVDARSDQFSYCVTLFEALYGTRPFAGKDRLARSRAARLGRIRSVPPGTNVPASIQGIVQRGLDPDPERRWPDLPALTSALQRATARRGKLAVWAIVGGAAATAATLAWGTSGARCDDVGDELVPVWNSGVAQSVATGFSGSNLSYADATWERVGSRLDTFANRWQEARGEVCEASDVAPEHRELRLACLARRRAELAAVVEVFTGTDADTVRQAVQITQQLGDIDACAHAEDDLGELVPPRPEVAARVQALREDLASVLIYAESKRFERALEVGRAVVREADEIGYDPLRAEARQRHGQSHADVGDYVEASQLQEEAYYIALECGHDPIAAKAAAALAFNLGVRQGRSDQTQPWLRAARSAAERLGPAGASARARVSQVEGTIALREADYGRARDLLATARDDAIALLGGDDLQVAQITGNLGVAQINRGDFDAAHASFTEALQISERVLGPEHPDVSSWVNNLGVLEQNRGNHEASLEYFRRAYDIESAIFGVHPNAGMALNNLGGALSLLERQTEAKEYFERSIAAYDGAQGHDPIDVARPVGNLGRTLVHLAEYDEGIAYMEKAVSMIEGTAGTDHPELSALCLNLGDAYLRQGHFDRAIAYMERALTIDRKALGLRHPFVAVTLASLAEVYLSQDRREAAVPLLEEALEIQTESVADPENRGATRFSLAQALWDVPGQRARAEQLLAEAEDELRASQAADDRLAALERFKTEH